MNSKVGVITGIVVLLILLLSVALIISHSPSTTSNVRVNYEGSYPWLSQGTYADYRSYVSFGDPPWGFTSSGQLLTEAPEQPGTPNNPVNGWLPGTGSASLNWTVTSRSGNNVLLEISFSNVGCQDNATAWKAQNQSAIPCTYYNFATTIPVMVNLTSDEVSVRGVDQGLLNFWEPALLENTRINSGSVIINQQKFVSIANVSAPMESSILGLSPGMQSVNVSGVPYTIPIKIYEVIPTSFGSPLLNYQVGWMNSSGIAFGSNIQENAFGPNGYYDFYNGLAYEFDLPQYPIDQTICHYNQGQPSNCELANVSTTLGEFFHSGLGTMLLRSTNIPLSTNQQQSEMTLQYLPLFLINGLAVTFLLVATCKVCFFDNVDSNKIRAEC